MGWDRKNTVIVSGIGCSARISEYFNLDSMHVTHGRTIPVAEGIKLANPDINVVIISGDGDLVSIGGNHLLHAIERLLPFISMSMGYKNVLTNVEGITR